MNPDLTCDLGIISRGTQAPAALVGSHLLFSLNLNTGSPSPSLRDLNMFFSVYSCRLTISAGNFTLF